MASEDFMRCWDALGMFTEGDTYMRKTALSLFGHKKDEIYTKRHVFCYRNANIASAVVNLLTVWSFCSASVLFLYS